MFLAKNSILSRSAIERLIMSGRVTVNGRLARKNQKVSGCELIKVDEPDPVPDKLLPENLPLDIVYEDEDILVINKPRGLCVHPAPGNQTGTLCSALLFYCGESLSGIGGVKRPGIVHRLDKNTAGLMMVAKNDMAHIVLSDALKNRHISRKYEGLCRGKLKEDCFTVNAPIARHSQSRKKHTVCPEGRESVTHVRVAARYPGYTLAGFRLETGRTHQIRVHMCHIGHPLAGDDLYGGKKGELGLYSQCLCATELSFDHPKTGQAMNFTVDRPEWFEAALEQLIRK